MITRSKVAQYLVAQEKKSPMKRKLARAKKKSLSKRPSGKLVMTPNEVEDDEEIEFDYLGNFKLYVDYL